MSVQDSLKRSMKPLVRVILILLFTLLLIAAPKQTHASLFDDFIKEMNNTLRDGVDGVKDLVTPKDKNSENKVLSLESEIKLAPDGDINKNMQIDAGDTLKFTYVITNPTTNTLDSVTLKTNIDTKKLNGVSDAIGVLSIDLQNNTVTVPGITIKPNQIRTISFQTQVNYTKDSDELVSTEAELVDGSNNSVLKSAKKEVSAKKMDEERFNKFVHITK